MNFLFKSATYIFLWKKFQKQIVTLIFSLLLVILIVSIYEDLYKIVSSNNEEYLIYLFFSKWLLVSLIVAYNIYEFKKISISSVKNDENINIEKELPQKSKNIIEKKEKLKSRTDFILDKYESDLES